MKQRNVLLFALVFIVISSCNQVYKEWEKESFSTLSWKPGNDIAFYPEIEDTTQSYSLTLGIRHLYGSSLDEIRLIAKSVSPSRKEHIEKYTLKLKNEKGESLANCTGNICDFETIVDKNLRFSEAGKHTFSISPDPEGGRIVGIMEFGFIVHSND